MRQRPDLSHLLSVCHLRSVQSVKSKAQAQHNQDGIYQDTAVVLVQTILYEQTEAKLNRSIPLIANEGVVEVIVDHKQLFNKSFIQQLRDELHHPSLHVLTHQVQLLLSQRRRQKGEKSNFLTFPFTFLVHTKFHH